MTNKVALIHQVKAIILQHAKPERIYLYGSQVSGEANQSSDIDIAYDDAAFKQHYLIEERVEQLATLIKIDVKNIAKTSERFKQRVKSTGKVLYSATKKLRAEDGFYNFSHALTRFNQALDYEKEIKAEGFADIYLDLMVKRFEFTYEMAWKALKRYLDYLGFDVRSPRMVFKEAYAQAIISDEAIWLDIIEQRNLSAHVYDEFEIVGIIEKVKQYQQSFTQLSCILAENLNIDTH